MKIDTPIPTASGTDTYAVAFNPTLTVYETNQVYYVLFTNANTGASTLNVDGLGDKAIKMTGTVALAASTIKAGQIIPMIYDGTNFQLLGGGGGGGSVTYGTTAGTATEGNDTRVVKDEISCTFDGAGGVIALNTNAVNPATSSGATITGWYIEGDVSGSIVIDIKKNGTSMPDGGGNKPTLSSATTANAVVSGWTSTTFVANDRLEIIVTTGATNITKCWVVFKIDITS